MLVVVDLSCIDVVLLHPSQTRKHLRAFHEISEDLGRTKNEEDLVERASVAQEGSDTVPGLDT
jgi:hypothetical protein